MSTDFRETPPPSTQTHGAGSGAGNWLELALIVAIFFIAGGAPVPHVNETHYLTKAKHYWDPTYCRGDSFLDSADPHIVFYWTFGWITRFASLPTVAWIGRSIAWLLLAIAWLRLARAVTLLPWAAALSAALWVMLAELGNFAGEWAVGGVEAKCFAYAFVLLGLAAMARGNWKAPWIWFGVAAAFHVLVGAWAVLAVFCVWLTEPRSERPPLSAMLPALILGGCLSLPGLLPALALERDADPSVRAEAARVYVFDRLPHHLAPLSLPEAEVHTRMLRFGVLVAAFIASCAWTSRQLRAIGTTPETADAELVGMPLSRIMRFAAFALLANCIGLVIEAALASQPLTAARILRYYWFRQADIAVPLAVALAVAHWSITLLRKRTWRATAAGLIPVVACGWFLTATALKRLGDPRPPAVARMVRYQDWQEACAWVNKHTPPDSRFLIPRAGHSFKWYASRADVVNYKDVPQDAASVVEWRRRCEELFPTVQGLDGEPLMLSSPDQWGASRVRSLARKFGASHVIARTYPPLDLPVAYPRDENSDSYYTVYETGESTTQQDP